MVRQCALRHGEGAFAEKGAFQVEKFDKNCRVVGILDSCFALLVQCFDVFCISKQRSLSGSDPEGHHSS
jgi:hypothetical protein